MRSARTCSVVHGTVVEQTVDVFELRKLNVGVDLDRIVDPAEVNRVHRVADYTSNAQLYIPFSFYSIYLATKTHENSNLRTASKTRLGSTRQYSHL